MDSPYQSVSAATTSNTGNHIRSRVTNRLQQVSPHTPYVATPPTPPNHEATPPTPCPPPKRAPKRKTLCELDPNIVPTAPANDGIKRRKTQAEPPAKQAVPKNVNQMENTRHVREKETPGRRQQRQRKDTKQCHHRAAARAIRRGTTPPPALTPTPSPEQAQFVCQECGDLNPLETATYCPHPRCYNFVGEGRWCEGGHYWTIRRDHIRNQKEQSRCNHCHALEQTRNQRRRRQPANPQPPVPPPLVEPEISLDRLWSRVRDGDLAAPACSTKDWNLIASYY